jgi:hypothetical protein
MSHLNKGKTLAVAAAHADMDEKTARKWARRGKLPSECAAPHSWNTRQDPFEDVWEQLETLLKDNPKLQAKTLFEHLQRQFPGRFADGQLRTLQRRVKVWRATKGPAREVFFPQQHRPGILCASDFTHMSALGIRIAGQPFPHLLYHFVLTYSNWETVTLCFSESFEALADGLQNALFELGGVPQQHRSDRLTAAIRNMRQAFLDKKRTGKEARTEFTRHYQALLAHYGLQASATQAGHGNENGDAEQRHYRLKDAVDQALMLRGSREFDSRADYEHFLRQLLAQLNAGRRPRLAQEQNLLKPLPESRLDARRQFDVRVGPASTISLLCNVYSVPSRLIGEWLKAHVGAETIALYYGQTLVESVPRLRGRGAHRIEYRHIIDWLVRKPGAFANYRYRGDLFPSSCFRVAYDLLCEQTPTRADREYLGLLQLAAKESEPAVEAALKHLLDRAQVPLAEAVEALLSAQTRPSPVTQVDVAPVDLSAYDALLLRKEPPSC